MKMTKLRITFFIVALLVRCVSAGALPIQDSTMVGSKPDSKTAAAILAVLDAQRDAWNRGDIEGYMDGYARSADTVFVSGDNVTHGWQTVLDHYKKGYDSREKMGVLTFSDLEITPLGKDAATVIGRRHLQRAK